MYHMRTAYLVALCGVILITSIGHADDAKQPEAPKWVLKAEDALVGTWLNTNPATQSIPKVEIFRDGAQLKIRFWGRTHPQDTPFGPPDALFVLSDYSEAANRSSKPPIATAFATHKADFAMLHFTLRLSDQGLRIEGVTLFTDDSKRSNRIMVETFKK